MTALTGALRTAIHNRTHLRHHGYTEISRQRRLALWMSVFAAVRTVVWVAAMALIVAHWLGGNTVFLHGFITLSGTVVFVTFISFYCNASTDAANLAASIAALYSADSHATAIGTSAVLSADFASLEADIARLATLQPGEEATALAAGIRHRMGIHATAPPEGNPA